MILMQLLNFSAGSVCACAVFTILHSASAPLTLFLFSAPPVTLRPKKKKDYLRITNSKLPFADIRRI